MCCRKKNAGVVTKGEKIKIKPDRRSVKSLKEAKKVGINVMIIYYFKNNPPSNPFKLGYYC